MTGTRRRWHCCKDVAALADAVVERIVLLADEAIAARRRFAIVLAGGSTPRSIYRQLSEQPASWQHWEVFFGDERCYPPGHAERNDTMADAAWLSRVSIPAEQVHRIPAELGPAAAAQRYAATLALIDTFDLVLLGLGEDGHTASLFPGMQLGGSATQPAVLAVEDAPKPPAQRVSLSAQRLSTTRALFFIATGMSKQQALAQLARGASIPASQIQPAAGVDVYTDQPSAAPA